MKSADGATPNLLFKIPRLAEMRAKGIISFNISSAPWENGSKIGMSLDTLSRLKAETDATLPVLKKADWRSVRKKRETRASDKVSDRNGEDVREAGAAAAPFVMVLVFGFS
jgi:hypothetical protein